MNYSKFTQGIFYSHIKSIAWTSMFRNSCSHFSTGFAHLSIVIVIIVMLTLFDWVWGLATSRGL